MFQRVSSRPVVVEMFAGAGLFSHAFVKEGFRVAFAVELNKVAAATYRANLGPHIEVGDVRSFAPEGPCDVLVAGPPCQGFSTLGRRDPLDPRNQLALEVCRWAKSLRPRTVVVENVASFLESAVWQRMARSLRGQGYTVTKHVLDAVDFGVPQYRKRSITFATRGRAPLLYSGMIRGPSNVKEAFEGLSHRPDENNLHCARTPSSLALARMRVIPPGGDKRDVMRRAPRLAPRSWWKLGSGQITDVWGRMEWNKPSNTLRTCLLNPSKGRYIHPEEHRVITLREAARLQSVPDDWTFCGVPWQIARHIGNSVPPGLGRAVARAVHQAL